MEKGVKIAIALGSTLALATGGYFIYRGISKKQEEQAEKKAANERIGYEDTDPNKLGSIAPLVPLGLPVPNTTPSLATQTIDGASVPLAGFGNLSDMFTNATTATETIGEPTAKDYIRMADRYMTWDNVWSFGSKLGTPDRKMIGGVADAYTTAAINNDTRKSFDEEVGTKFPNWKSLLKNKAKDLGVPIVSDEDYIKNTNSIKSAYGISMLPFNGSPLRNERKDVLANFLGLDPKNPRGIKQGEEF